MGAGGIIRAAGYPAPEKLVVFSEMELEVPLALVHTSACTQRQCKPGAAGKITFSFFCRCYLANCHHLDSHYPFCLLTGGFVQNVPEENSRYLVYFLCRGQGRGGSGEDQCAIYY